MNDAQKEWATDPMKQIVIHTKNKMIRYKITNANNNNNNSSTNGDIPMKIQTNLCYNNGPTIDVCLNQ